MGLLLGFCLHLQVVKAAREKGLEYFFEEYVREHPRGYHSISLEARLCAAAEGYIPQGGEQPSAECMECFALHLHRPTDFMFFKHRINFKQYFLLFRI